MSRETAILGRGLSASVRTYAREHQADQVFPALLFGIGELASLEYHDEAGLAVLKVCYDPADREAAETLFDEEGEAWLKVFQEEAIPFAAMTVGPGKCVYLGPAEAAKSPAAMIASIRPGQPDGDLVLGEDNWAAFDASVREWLPTTPYETEGAGNMVEIAILKVAAPDGPRVEEALVADARAAHKRLQSSATQEKSQVEFRVTDAEFLRVDPDVMAQEALTERAPLPPLPELMAEIKRRGEAMDARSSREQAYWQAVAQKHAAESEAQHRALVACINQAGLQREIDRSRAATVQALRIQPQPQEKR